MLAGQNDIGGVRAMHKMFGPIALVFAAATCGCDQRDPSPMAEPKSTKQLTALPSTAYLPVKNPFPNATETRLFVRIAYGKNDDQAWSKPGGRTLSAAQRSDFEAALRSTKPPEMIAACFVPHHFFRYYDQRGKQVGQIDVCFCCAGISASDAANLRLPPGQILDADYAKLRTLVRSVGEPTEVLCD